MTTLEAARLLLTYLRTNWQHFAKPERVSLGVDAVLAVVLMGSVFWAPNVYSAVLALVFVLYLVVSTFATAMGALVRISQHEMTADYLAQYDGEHTLTGPAGQTARFDTRDGWVEVRTEQS